MFHLPPLTPHQSQYIAWLLSKQTASSSVEDFAATLVDAQVDLNPHQVDAALFACKNPLSQGVILADEVGLGKTIEAGLVILQRWAERKRRILIITPANLRKQWHQELQEKFGLTCEILESKNYHVFKKQGENPFDRPVPIICSYQFAKAKAADIKKIPWDLAVLDEAHRLRNVYKKSNIIGNTLKDALSHVRSKVLLTATPLQNDLRELYGLVSMIDERVFGGLESFRSQFGSKTSEQNLFQLQRRLRPICQRTLRRQVQAYVAYTKRHPIVQAFTPSDAEKELAELVREYLRREDSQALQAGQRHLIAMVLWKLLASSSRAIAGALGTMLKRLQKEWAEETDTIEQLNADFDGLEDTTEEWTEDEADKLALSEAETLALADEIEELKRFKTLAESIDKDAKSEALLAALEKAFDKLCEKNAPQKAIIFTESKRTQDYLLQCLADTPYAGENGEGIVLFNGTNSDKNAQKIYKDWLKRHAGSDTITGSKTADTRAALVEHFKEKASIMIATEAGSEGINLQFCSLIINYDLPWNPQRIEQRIGRCHRYGQKHDVVVVNFLDQSNEADARVYELLEKKFQLFDGVFGASDEVLGAIGSGVDIEKRIADIYRRCRKSEEIQAAFDILQQELSGEIDEAMMQTRQILLEHFDESVSQRLRVYEEEGRAVRTAHERLLLQFTQSELGENASFDAYGFTLHRLPENLAAEQKDVPIGRYRLPSQQGEAHLYRLQHPLAQSLLEQAKNRRCPEAKLIFDYPAYGSKISTLEPYIGKSGTLIASLITITALERSEQHVIISACTDAGEILIDDDPEKLLRLPATLTQPHNAEQAKSALAADRHARFQDLLEKTAARNLVYFDQEIEKLDSWADGLKDGLEQEIKATDKAIKEIKRESAAAQTAQEKLSWQKKQRELERKRTKQRRELFDQQDEIETMKDELIEGLEASLDQKIEEKTLFVIEWEVV